MNDKERFENALSLFKEIIKIAGKSQLVDLEYYANKSVNLVKQIEKEAKNDND